jgi:hypothetical protein
MSGYYVYSTLTSDQIYTKWSTPADGSIPEVEHEVNIKGGANLSDKHFVTPRGVVTRITDADYEYLVGKGLEDMFSGNSVFKKHVKNGFITVRKDSVDPEIAVAAGMKQKDQSAPVTPNDFPDIDGKIQPENKDGNKDQKLKRMMV